ncbi:hypothetical protein GCM10007301_38140 [Azorhizobium oxalatiphilum]|uniref:Uncharacterized protein n=2 Tax=Azorhizobium oxalatiphilum TaxID=980631 RepID=A0A917C9V2_9HYPH|nr:hypothetical protein GCM10007301_38140 [Azorhizobium oxalatiphilum]
MNGIVNDAVKIKSQRVDRSPHYITFDQFLRAYHAVQYSNYQGFVLNAHLTMSWKYAGATTAAEAERLNTKAMDRIRKFLHHRGVPFHYFGVFENGVQHGCHFHSGIHVPKRLMQQFYKCLKNIVHDFGPSDIEGCLVHVGVRADDHIVSQWKWFRYCMKGLDPEIPRGVFPDGYDGDMNSALGLKKQNTGVVEMDRVRIARALGPQARSLARYTPAVEIIREVPEPDYSDAEYRRGKQKRLTDDMSYALRGMEELV